MKDLEGYRRIFKDIEGYSRIFKDIEGYWRILKDLVYSESKQPSIQATMQPSKEGSRQPDWIYFFSCEGVYLYKTVWPSARRIACFFCYKYHKCYTFKKKSPKKKDYCQKFHVFCHKYYKSCTFCDHARTYMKSAFWGSEYGSPGWAWMS